jgi:hypothetical protein
MTTKTDAGERGSPTSPIPAGISDEERLKNMELYLNTAIGLCNAIRKRWER